MKLNKELEPVFTNPNTIKALMVTVDRQGRIVAFNKVCEQLTGYSFNEVKGRYIWDLFLIPEEVEPFKAVCENLKAGNCAEYNYESYWVTKDGHHRRITWSNSALFNNEGALEYVISTGIDISEKRLLFERYFTNPFPVRRSKTRRVGGLIGEPFCVSEAQNSYEDEQGSTSVESRARYRQPWANELNQHNRRIQLLSLVALKIRQSLELEEILQTTVTEVRHLLQADRVLIYRLWSDGTGSAVTEAVVPGWPSILGQTFEPEVFPEEYHQLYASGRVGAIQALETADIAPCLVEFLQQFGVKAKLVVPILLKDKLWGLLVAHQCNRTRQWSSFEIELLRQLADQLSIALVQAQYQDHLEELVAERTAKLTHTLEQLRQEIADRKRAEEALTESEERWRSLVQNAPDIIFTCDREGKLLFINRTVPGFTVEQTIGTSVYDYIPADYQDTLRQSFERVFQTGESVDYETVGFGANGTLSWYASRVGSIQHEGQVVAAIVISTDITARKQAEELLHRHEQEFRALVENSPDLVARFDPQLRHVYVNPSVERITGIPKQAFIGKTNQDLGMPQELVARWDEALLDVLATGLEHIVAFDFPTRSEIKSYQTRIVPELTQDGRIGSLLGVTRDITECKQAEEALRQRLLREQALNQVVRTIRNTLDLETIFSTTVEEIGKLLQVDRVVIVQYLRDRKLWLNVADYRQRSDLPVALGLEIPDEDNEIAARLKRSEVVLIDNASQWHDEVNRTLAQSYPGAWLLVPLHFGSSVWGSLSLVVENRPYPWQDSEVELTLAVAEQLAIAIQQAELLRRSCTATVEAQEQATKLEREVAERRRTEETLRSLYKVSTARKLSFDQRLQGLLALGRRQFGLPMGALARVENDVCEVVAAQIPAKSNLQISKGSRWNLQQTYCHETLKAQEPIAFESAGTSHWSSHPAYTLSRVETYIGMPVVAAGQVYGTLSFFSLEARQHPFTAGDKELLKLMAQWVGAFLERQQSEEELRHSEARFRELAQREALLNQLASQIRRSLDLNTILETTVHEIRELLQIDRCFFLWYRPDANPPAWEVVREAKSATFPSLIDYRVPLTTFGPLTTRVFNKEITRVDSARALTDPVERKFFFTIGYTALLALPIHTTSGEIGVVSCGHSSGPRPWRDEEVELLRAVSDQLAIAIDQAQLLNQSRTATEKARQQATQLEHTLRELQETQSQLIQSEKMSSLGQLIAGIAHEINNPTNFIYGNIGYVNEYAEDLFNLIHLYQEHSPKPGTAIEALSEEIDLDFIKEDLPKILTSMRMGAERISQIVLSLRNFSRLDEAEMKWADIHEGLDNTLMILAHRLRAKKLDISDIQVIKDYSYLPKVQCYPGQLNQVFMNILTNAIDAIEENYQERSFEQNQSHPGLIWICTQVLIGCNQVVVLISDNGPGMTPQVQRRIFDPFFTTKPVGQGTGLGMSISYQIVVERHGGQLQCISAPGQGTAFLISLPISQ